MKKLVSIIVALGLAVAFAAPTFAMDAPAGAPLPFKLRRIKSLGRNTGARSKTSYEELVTPPRYRSASQKQQSRNPYGWLY